MKRKSPEHVSQWSTEKVSAETKREDHFTPNFGQNTATAERASFTERGLFDQKRPIFVDFCTLIGLKIELNGIILALFLGQIFGRNQNFATFV